MSKRSIWIYGTVALVGCVGGATFAMWSSNDQLNETAVVTSLRSALPYAQRPWYSGNVNSPVSVTHPLDLRLSDPLTKSGAASLDAPRSSSKPHATPQQARAERDNSATGKAKRSALDLKLPDNEKHTLVKADDDDAPTLPELTVVETGAAFDLQPQTVVAPHVKSYSLFNPEYGLRGFMTQGWLNQHFGIQGGLGFNDERRIKTDSTFRDDIAVGMGVVLAF